MVFVSMPTFCSLIRNKGDGKIFCENELIDEEILFGWKKDKGVMEVGGNEIEGKLG